MTLSDPDSTDVEKARILGETARIGWAELQRWFASGTAIYVAPELDLVEVAYELSLDNAGLLREWMAEGRVSGVTDAQALAWLEADALVWAVVVKPWVLVQPAAPDTEH